MKEFKICDTHNDFLTELELDEIVGYVESCGQVGVESICASYWTTEKVKEEILMELPIRAQIMQEVNQNFLLHIEDLWWVENEEDLQFLLDLHPYSCSLTWNNQNCLAGGAKSEGKLTDWGKRVLFALLDAGVVVDVAHLNRKSFWQVARLIGKNIYCSHTGFYGVRHTQRNLTDKQLDAIVRSGGFVGMFFFDKCVKISRAKSVEFGVQDIVANLQYFTSRWGFHHIGIGSDFYGIETYPQNLENYADFQNLALALENVGWTKEQIDKVFYKNFKSFCVAE